MLLGTKQTPRHPFASWGVVGLEGSHFKLLGSSNWQGKNPGPGEDATSFCERWRMLRNV